MTKKITKRRVGRYSDEVRERAAIEYAVCGNMTQVSKAMDIHYKTLSAWKAKGLMDETIAKVQSEKADEHRATYSKIVDLSQQQTIKTIGEASAAQANLISCQAWDKIRLSDNMPTTIRGDSQTMLELADTFKAITREYRTVGSTYRSLKDKD